MLRLPRVSSKGSLLLCALLFCPGLVAAEEFYLSVEGLQCPELPCACDVDAPCRAQSFDFSRLRSGDSVHFAAGVYAPMKIEDVRGTRDLPIAFKGADGSSTGKYSTVFEGDGRSVDVLEFKLCAFVSLQNVQIRNAKRAGVRINASHGVSLRALRIERVGVWGVFTNHANEVSVVGSTILGPGEQHGIYLSNSGDRGLLQGNRITNFLGSGIQLNGDKSMGSGPGVAGDGVISGVEIRGNYIAANGASGGAAINLDGAVATRIESNVLVANQAAGIAAFKADGAVHSRDTFIARNLIMGASDSRPLLILSSPKEKHTVLQNHFVSRNPRGPLLEIVNVSQLSLRARWSGNADLSSRFSGNSYYWNRTLARIGASEVLNLSDWISLSGEENAVQIPTDLIAGEEDETRRGMQLKRLIRGLDLHHDTIKAASLAL